MRALYSVLSILTLLASAGRGMGALAGTVGRRFAHRGLASAMRRRRRK